VLAVGFQGVIRATREAALTGALATYQEGEVSRSAVIEALSGVADLREVLLAEARLRHDPERVSRPSE
jgi:hypothetical protein